MPRKPPGRGVPRRLDAARRGRRRGAATAAHLHAAGPSLRAGELGERYRIHLVNPTAARVEAVISVDGLDAIDGRPASLGKRGYVLPAFADVTIDGWRTSMDTVAAFRFASVRDSYAARTSSDRNVGVIGVAFFRERPPVVVRAQPPVASRDSAPAGAPAPKAAMQDRAGLGTRLRRVARFECRRDLLRARRREPDGHERASLRRPPGSDRPRHPARSGHAPGRDRATRPRDAVPHRPLRPGASLRGREGRRQGLSHACESALVLWAPEGSPRTLAPTGGRQGRERPRSLPSRRGLRPAAVEPSERSESRRSEAHCPGSPIQNVHSLPERRQARLHDTLRPASGAGGS